MVAAGGAARQRAIAAFAGGAFDLDLAALAIFDRAALGDRLLRRGCSIGHRPLLGGHGLAGARLRLGLTRRWAGEVATGERNHLLAELVAQHTGLDLVDLAFTEFEQLERAVGDADQPVHLKTEMRQHVADFAVLALANREHQPDIGALVTLQLGLDRAILHAVDLDAVLQFVKLRLGDLAMRADAVAPQPAGLRQLECASETAVIGEQQQAFSVEVEPADRDQPRQPFGQMVEHRRATFRIAVRRHQAARLVIQEQPRALALRQRLAVDGDDVARFDVERRAVDHLAVDGDTPFRDPRLGVAA